MYTFGLFVKINNKSSSFNRMLHMKIYCCTDYYSSASIHLSQFYLFIDTAISGSIGVGRNLDAFCLHIDRVRPNFEIFTTPPPPLSPHLVTKFGFIKKFKTTSDPPTELSITFCFLKITNLKQKCVLVSKKPKKTFIYTLKRLKR